MAWRYFESPFINSLLLCIYSFEINVHITDRAFFNYHSIRYNSGWIPVYFTIRFGSVLSCACTFFRVKTLSFFGSKLVFLGRSGSTPPPFLSQQEISHFFTNYNWSKAIFYQQKFGPLCFSFWFLALTQNSFPNGLRRTNERAGERERNNWE